MERIILGSFEKVKISKTAGESSNLEILAKIDTGAFSGVINAKNIKEENGILSFNLSNDEKKRFETAEFIRRRVRNTHGGTKIRYLVNFEIQIENKKFEGLFGLDDREKMKFEMLIGRAFLVKHNLLVDPIKNLELDKEWKEMGKKQ